MRFNAIFNDGTYLNIPADRMDVRDNAFIIVQKGDKTVAVVDICGIISAYMSEKSMKGAQNVHDNDAR